MEIKHTPGPWNVQRRSTRGQFVRTTHIVSADESHITEVGPCLIEENAKLIAAAPEMLESLIKWMNYFESESEDQNANKEFDIYWSTHELLKKLKE